MITAFTPFFLSAKARSFASSIQDINNQEQEGFEFEIKVEKKKTIKVKKLLRDIVSTQARNTDDIKIDIKKYKPEKYEYYLLGSELIIDASGKAILKQDTMGSKKLKETNHIPTTKLLSS